MGGIGEGVKIGEDIPSKELERQRSLRTGVERLGDGGGWEDVGRVVGIGEEWTRR